MTDPDFETALGRMLRAPGDAERPDLTAAVMRRVAQDDRQRRAALTGATLLGVGIAAAMAAMAGAFDAAVWTRVAALAPADPGPFVLVAAGVVATLLATAVSALREG